MINRSASRNYVVNYGGNRELITVRASRQRKNLGEESASNLRLVLVADAVRNRQFENRHFRNR